MVVHTDCYTKFVSKHW